MPKKKSVKKNKPTRKIRNQMDDNSFLTIVGGGFIIIVLVGLLLINKRNVEKLELYHQLISLQQQGVQQKQTVSIKDFAFSPTTITVKAGSPVMWQNNDAVSHEVVADDRSFDTGVLNSGEKGSYTFSKAGEYTYKCGIHPSMVGKVIVEE